MAGYLLRRFLQAILFVFLGMLLIYTVLVMLMPASQGGPKAVFDSLLASHLAEGTSVEEAIANDHELSTLAKQYKVDKPWPLNYLVWLFDSEDTTQLGGYLGNEIVQKGIDVSFFGLTLKGSGILTGDFGKSSGYARGRFVTELIADRWDHTFLLILYALIIAVLVAVPLGVVGAIRHRTATDHATTFFSIAGVAVPSFALGLLLIVFLSVLPVQLRNTQGWAWLPYLPSGGLGDRDNFGDRIYHMTLPALTLAIPQIAWLARYIRFSMLEVLRQDYVRTAWAKGLRWRGVMLKHALRNALLPVITLVGFAVPAIASTAIVVETVFSYQGLGQLFYRGMGGCLEGLDVFSRAQEPPPCPRIGYLGIDRPIALGMFILLLSVIALASLIADFLYTVADPRVSFRSRHRA